MNILDEIDANIKAKAKLRRISEGSSESLTRDEASRIVKSLDWLSEERSQLLSALPED